MWRHVAKAVLLNGVEALKHSSEVDNLMIMISNIEAEPLVDYFGISSEPSRPENILWTDEPWRGRITFTGKKSARKESMSIG